MKKGLCHPYQPSISGEEGQGHTPPPRLTPRTGAPCSRGGGLGVFQQPAADSKGSCACRPAHRSRAALCCASSQTHTCGRCEATERVEAWQPETHSLTRGVTITHRCEKGGTQTRPRTPPPPQRPLCPCAQGGRAQGGAQAQEYRGQGREGAPSPELTATLQTLKPTPPAPSPEAASTAATPGPGLSRWASQPGPEGELHPHPSQPPTPLDPHPVQPRDPPRVTAMPLREPRAPPHPGQPRLKPTVVGVAATGPDRTWLSPRLTWPSLLLQEASCPRPALGLLRVQDRTGLGPQNHTRSRRSGWAEQEAQTALAQPASPGLGLWDPPGPGAGAGGSPGECGHLPGQTEAQLRERPPRTP